MIVIQSSFENKMAIIPSRHRPLKTFDLVLKIDPDVDILFLTLNVCLCSDMKKQSCFRHKILMI